MTAKRKDLTFEEASKRLEEIVAELETGEAPLEKAIGLYEEGRKLGDFCTRKLDELETRVRLVREAADGRVEEEPFEEEPEA